MSETTNLPGIRGLAPHAATATVDAYIDELTGAGTLDPALMARAFVPMLLHPARWIHRRVQTVEILSDQRSRRRTSVDLTVPPYALPVASGGLPGLPPGTVVLPVGLLSKAVLRSFDVSDEGGQTMPILDALQNSQIGQQALLTVAEGELEQVGLQLSDKVRTLIIEMVNARENKAGEKLFGELRSLLESPAPNDEYQTLKRSWRFMALAADLSTLFPLSMIVRGEVGQRRVLRYTFEDPYQPKPAHRLLALLKILKQLWQPIRFEFVVWAKEAGNTKSYHLEVPAPPGSFAREATLHTIDREPLTFALGEKRLIDRQENVEIVHFVCHDVPRGNETAGLIRFGLHAAGLMTPLLFSAALSFGVFFAGVVLHAFQIHSVGGSPTAIVLAFNGLWAATFFRPSEHRLITALAFRVRVMAGAIAAGSLVGAGVLSVQLPTTVKWWTWFALLLIVFAAALSIGLAWYSSWHVWSVRK